MFYTELSLKDIFFYLLSKDANKRSWPHSIWSISTTKLITIMWSVSYRNSVKFQNRFFRFREIDFLDDTVLLKWFHLIYLFSRYRTDTSGIAFVFYLYITDITLLLCPPLLARIGFTLRLPLSQAIFGLLFFCLAKRDHMFHTSILGFLLQCSFFEISLTCQSYVISYNDALLTLIGNINIFNIFITIKFS